MRQTVGLLGILVLLIGGGLYYVVTTPPGAPTAHAQQQPTTGVPSTTLTTSGAIHWTDWPRGRSMVILKGTATDYFAANKIVLYGTWADWAQMQICRDTTEGERCFRLEEILP